MWEDVAMARLQADGDTANRILDVAERLVQKRGFNGFSYADVAAELRVTKASLHYHFAGKADLGEALLDRYASRFAEALAEIDASGSDARGKLDAYASLYAAVLRDERMCLCGMLAAEYQTLPVAMRTAVLRFFDDNESWVAGVLASGRRAGTLSFDGSAREIARLIISGLEGAMLVARSYGDVARFGAAARRLVGSLAAVPPERVAR
jgi:TetR/AcrR family transcriptional repressor of nem operon